MKEKAKKRLFVFALCACVALGSIGASIADYSAETVSADTTADGAFTTDGTGNGSEISPYLIDTAQELYYISTKANSFKDKYIKMTADIDLSEYGTSFNGGDGWPGIAYFGRHFDGDGHSIKNLYTTKTGLFASLTQGTEPSVSNLVTENATVVSESNNTGIIVGQLKNGKVENCTVKNTCSVTGAQAVGGIVGTLDGGSISGCTNYANVVSASANGCVGGIVGTVVSKADNRTITVQKCVNRGKVSAAVKNVGGIVGQFNAQKATCTFTLRECVNYGAVNGGSSTGGVIGISQSANTYNATVKDCYNVGLVTGAPAAGNFIGGFVGNGK